MLLKDEYVRVGPHLLGERGLHGRPGGVGDVDDAALSVPAFPREVEADWRVAVGRERHSMLDQPVDRAGAVLDHKAGSLVRAQARSGRVGVSDVGFSAVSRVEDGCDATLGPRTGTVLQGSLGNEGNLELVSETQREGLPGKATAQDKDIKSGHFGNCRRGRYYGVPTITWALRHAERRRPCAQLNYKLGPGSSDYFGEKWGCLAVYSAVGDLSGHDNEGSRSPTMSDREIDQLLVERVQRGDKQAFGLLVSKYQRKLGRLLSRLIRDPAEVEDVAQETFIKAYRALPSFRGDSAFYTWLYRIGINTAKNYLVSQGRRAPTSTDFDSEEAETFEEGDQLRDINTPERLLMTKQIGDTVNVAMEALPEELRTAIVLREIEGLSYEEIASIMECPIGTVRSRIFRAREAISEKLKPLLDTAPNKRW